METDLLIVGGGPAGLTAGIYAVRSGLRAAVVERAGVLGEAEAGEDLAEPHPTGAADLELDADLDLGVALSWSVKPLAVKLPPHRSLKIIPALLQWAVRRWWIQWSVTRCNTFKSFKVRPLLN